MNGLANKFQVLTITLLDGRTFNYTGPAMFEDDEELVVSKIAISPAKELPTGMYFGSIDEDGTVTNI